MTKKRISKRVREEAWLVCAIAASTPDLEHGASSVAFHLGMTREETSVGYRSRRLVVAAFEEAYKRPWTKNEWGAQDWCVQMAEAAALLADGWCPP